MLEAVPWILGATVACASGLLGRLGAEVILSWTRTSYYLEAYSEEDLRRAREGVAAKIREYKRGGWPSLVPAKNRELARLDREMHRRGVQRSRT